MRGAGLPVFGKQPARVALSGTVFRAVHDDLKQLVGQYKEVYWDENLRPSEQYHDLSHLGVVECYEVPARLLVRAGSWPLVTRAVAETNLMRLSEDGEFRLVRIWLDLLKWWAMQRSALLPECLDELDKRWSRRLPRTSSPLGFQRLIAVLELPWHLPEEARREMIGAHEALVDVVCTRVAGPAYVLALARFGLRGSLAPFGGLRGSYFGLDRHEMLTGAHVGEHAGRLVQPRERLAICLSTLEACGLQPRQFPWPYPASARLRVLDAKVLREVDRLLVRKPYDGSSQREAERLVSVLSTGQLAEGRPLLLLNALWHAVLKGGRYLNEPALVLSMAEHGSPKQKASKIRRKGQG